MGVRPPQQGNDEEPETIAFGIAAIDGHLDRADLGFPATREEIAAKLGSQEIPYNASGNSVELSTALEELPDEEFQNRQQLLNALHPIFEEYREQAKTSLVARVRSLLPF